jgi:gas vesicle protein
MSAGKVLLGVLAGAAAGALLGVLLAPDKGSVTRDKLAKLGEDYSGDLADKIKDLRDTVLEKVGMAENGVNETVSKFTRDGAGQKPAHAGSSQNGGGHGRNSNG